MSSLTYQAGLLGRALRLGFDPIIDAFIEIRYVSGEGYLGKGYLKEGYLMHQRWARSKCLIRVNVISGCLASQGIWNDTIPNWSHLWLWSST